MRTFNVRAASKIVVPAGTNTGWSSMVNSTSGASMIRVAVDKGIIISALSGLSLEANPRGTLLQLRVRLNLRRKMLQDRRDGGVNNLAQSADRAHAHRLK